MEKKLEKLENEHIMDLFKDSVKEDHDKKVNDKLEFILRKNYPDVDISNPLGLAKLVEHERLHIHIGDTEMDYIDSDGKVSVKAEVVVRVMKELF